MNTIFLSVMICLYKEEYTADRVRREEPMCDFIRKQSQIPKTQIDILLNENPFVSTLAKEMYPGITLFARDVNLRSELADKYEVGMIIREKGFTDASVRFGGMAATHRYVILSNHMHNLTRLEKGANWGLHVAGKDAHFKVLGKICREGKTGIFLLHLPDDETWKAYQTMEFSLDQELYEKAVQRFLEKAFAPPFPELASREWLDRCQSPVGMSDEGRFWLLEEFPATWRNTDVPAYPPVFSNLNKDQKIRYFQNAKYGNLYKSVIIDDSWKQWYQLCPESGVWLKDGDAGTEYEWGNLPFVREVMVDSDSYAVGIDLRSGGLIRTEFYAGRDDGCEIQLKGSRVSRRHACFYYNGEQWLIRDLNSTNGLELNGKRVQVNILNEGDQLRLGDAQIIFQGSSLHVSDTSGKRILCFPPKNLLDGALEREKRSRYRGCLLGGAVGDALGYPVEFMKENNIFRKYGEKGIQSLSQAGNPAVISDDTQMTLFAANALIRSASVSCDWTENLLQAYQEWLGTQGDVYFRRDKPVMWLYEVEKLHVRRAPGLTCMESLHRTAGKSSVVFADNNSKGCGTVMRAAPFGLSIHYDPASQEDECDLVARRARMDAALTHGHPAAADSSAVFACLIWEIVQHDRHRCYPLEEVVYQYGDAMNGLLKKAADLALDKTVSDLDGIHCLGEGWVADEALAIAVFCAVRYQKDFATAVRTAVNHRGDSDSTGAICGNILGAWLGEDAVLQAFDLKQLELGDVIKTIADDLYWAVNGSIPAPGKVSEWDRKYRRE